MGRSKRRFAVSLMIGVEKMESLQVQLPKDVQDATLEMINKALTKAIKDVQKQNSFPPYMTRKEASDYLHVSGTTFDKWLKAYHIPVIRIEGMKRYKRSSLDKAMEQLEQ